jgi:hypothetical protein
MGGYEIVFRWKSFFLARNEREYFIGKTLWNGSYASLHWDDLKFWKRRSVRTLFWKALIGRFPPKPAPSGAKEKA